VWVVAARVAPVIPPNVAAAAAAISASRRLRRRASVCPLVIPSCVTPLVLLVRAVFIAAPV
jgi:hypothetical protein